MSLARRLDALDSSLTPTQLVLRWYPALVDPVQHAIVREPLVPAGGWLDVPTRPGLGIDIDEAALERLAMGHFGVA